MGCVCVCLMNIFHECLSFFLSVWKEGLKERTDGSFLPVILSVCLEGRTDGSFLPVNAVRTVWRYDPKKGGMGPSFQSSFLSVCLEGWTARVGRASRGGGGRGGWDGRGRGGGGDRGVFFFFRFFWVLPLFLGGGWSGVATGYQHSLVEIGIMYIEGNFL